MASNKDKMNDYNTMSDNYVKSHEKPDKKYSMVPTALKIIGDLKGKKVIDIGCGDGFFTIEFAKNAELVYGIDNSEEQIKKAQGNKLKNILYQLADMNDCSYPKVDIIFSPFVLNYLEKVEQLESLFKKFYAALHKGGLFSGIIDLPQSTVHDMARFGSIKRLKKLEEGEKMDVELYTGEEHIITIHSFYHTKETIEGILGNIGFKEIIWHKPFISQEGLDAMGQDFWHGYIDNCDLAYFSARK